MAHRFRFPWRGSPVYLLSHLPQVTFPDYEMVEVIFPDRYGTVRKTVPACLDKHGQVLLNAARLDLAGGVIRADDFVALVRIRRQPF